MFQLATERFEAVRSLASRQLLVVRCAIALGILLSASCRHEESTRGNPARAEEKPEAPPTPALARVSPPHCKPAQDPPVETLDAFVDCPVSSRGVTVQPTFLCYENRCTGSDCCKSCRPGRLVMLIQGENGFSLLRGGEALGCRGEGRCGERPDCTIAPGAYDVTGVVRRYEHGSFAFDLEEATPSTIDAPVPVPAPEPGQCTPGKARLYAPPVPATPTEAHCDLDVACESDLTFHLNCNRYSCSCNAGAWRTWYANEDPKGRLKPACQKALPRCLSELRSFQQSRPPALQRRTGPRRTIPHGIYGQTTEREQVGPPRTPRPRPMAVSIFRAGKRTKPIAETTSDEAGFYQIALEADSYEACTSFRRCRSFRLNPGECVRLDYEFSAGVGWSLPTSEPCGADPP